MTLSSLKQPVEALIDRHKKDANSAMQAVCDLLQKEVSYYDWVGFYFAAAEKRELHLGPYAGLPTDHTVIPFGKGICGQVAESNENFVVPDVQAQDNYIACSISVKAEIVIPMFKDGVNIGQIDIDSDTADPFTKDDEEFLAWVNEQIARVL